MADQQAAGVVMWVPGDVVYAATLGVLFVRFLAAAEARAARREAPAALLRARGGGR
jgi:cytochrome c oxidase assembly factor CtaG